MCAKRIFFLVKLVFLTSNLGTKATANNNSYCQSVFIIDSSVIYNQTRLELIKMHPYIYYTTLLLLFPFFLRAQENQAFLLPKVNKDTCLAPVDSLLKIASSLFPSIPSFNDTISPVKKAFNEMNGRLNSLPKLNPQNPGSHFFRLLEGSISYNYTYRSLIDTPFAEKNISQHQQSSSFLIGVASLPIRVNSFIRKSNSNLFKDIVEFQIQFDGTAYRNIIEQQYYDQFSKKLENAKNSFDVNQYEQKLSQLLRVKDWVSNPQLKQKLIEANEILNVPAITYDLSASDSENLRKADSIKHLAREFIAIYTALKGKYDMLNAQVDSLKAAYEKSIQSIHQIEQIVKGNGGMDDFSYNEYRRQVTKWTSDSFNLFPKYRWVYGIRNFGIGKNQINSSELTANNISVTGINFEYNSWYYLSVTAGVVDFRFRDFALSNEKKIPQHLYLLRLGLGDLRRNYFILSAFKGQKQLFKTMNGSGHMDAIKILGLSAEAKWQVNRTTYVISEIGQSFSPDLKNIPPQKNHWDINDKTNKAFSIKFHSYFFKASARIEARYKFTGSNYQAFSNFHTNSELRSWYVKADKNFFNRKLKLLFSLSKNDFQNPYVQQEYKSNTTFATLNATLRIKKWPIVNVSYMPTSQLTIVGSQLQESRFQTLNASVSHYYKAGQMRGVFNVIYSKFYNNSLDTGYIYYNSKNIYLGQSFLFKNFSVDVNISYNQSASYRYIVMDESIRLPLSKLVSINAGVKVNKLNEFDVKLGQYINSEINVFPKSRLSFRIERSFLPGNHGNLLPMTWGDVNLLQTL